jgi:hypothetical protein
MKVNSFCPELIAISNDRIDINFADGTDPEAAVAGAIFQISICVRIHRANENETPRHLISLAAICFAGFVRLARKRGLQAVDIGARHPP